MIKFHFCKSFLKKIPGKSIEREIRKKISDLSNSYKLVSSGVLHDYGNGIYTLKIHNPLSKIIIASKTIDKEIIYFVRDFILEKDEGFYFGNFIHPKLKSGIWLNNNSIDKVDINKYINDKLITEKKSKVMTPKKPPKEMVKWLDDYELIIKYEIFESEDWVKYSLNENEKEGMRDKDVKSFANLLNNIINNTVLLSIKKIETSNNDIDTYIANSGNFSIIYSKLIIENTERFVLYNGAHINAQMDYWDCAQKLIETTDVNFAKSIDGLARFSYRAYPKWTINNDDLWFAIQKNNELSNLSLTQDQLLFFKNFTFPYYINGQAGSGKSTMLYYLFSNAYYYKCLDLIKGDIIFLTENKFLLDHTQKSVFDLLSNNPEFEGLQSEHLLDVNKYFTSFKDFLVGLISNDEKKYFPKKKYLNFTKFKELYENSHLSDSIKRKYSAEESWFTITTYIYGYDNSKKITSKDYEDTVYLKSQKIPKSKFEGIEKKVLPFYEKLIEENKYWDKLKILRYLEEKNAKIPKYSIVFCDEAQDFCRVELRFILKLSEYLDYDLSEMKQVPILFAGDANQTVNPTGFREREMTEMLYTELKELAKFEYKKSESVYNPLYNYRSKQPVVTLANFIQYYRKKHFDIRLVRPQIPKRPNSLSEPIPNIFFNYSDIRDNELSNDLIEKIKYKIFIIPVDKEESESFIEKHNLLKDVEKAEIKTSIEAKGAEYNQVVLYGFGDYYIDNFDNLSSNVINDDENFKRAYFFNKLYVAITRAQKELIIIDSKISEESFWKKIINKSEISEHNWSILNNYKESTIVYNPETLNNVIDSNREDARLNAEQDKKQGIYDQNSSRLRVAANQFYKIGDKKEYFLCLALSREYKFEWNIAAEHYLNSELRQTKLEDASRCYLIGKYFNELKKKIGKKLRTNEQDIRLIISDIMLNNPLNDSDINKLDNNRQVFRSTINNLEWRGEFIEKFMNNLEHNLKIETKRDLIEIFSFIANERDGILWELIAKFNFEVENYEKAVEAWDKTDNIISKEYVQSKISIADRKNDIESKVVWLYKSMDFISVSEDKDNIENKIISIFENYNKVNDVAPLFLMYVYNSYLIQRPEFPIQEIGKKVEFNFLNVNSIIIINNYEKLLTDTRLNNIVKEYLIARWFFVNNRSNNNSNEINKEKLKLYNTKLKTLIKEFKFYSIEDFNKIPEYPNKIKFDPPKHITDIEIFGFRQFKHLKLRNLGKYNLIVGDNNVGKTSILEALMFDDIKEKYFLNLAYAYIERKNSPIYLDRNTEIFNISDDFFESFFNKKSELKKIEYIITQKRNKWHYEIKRLSESELKKVLVQNTGVYNLDFYGFIKNSNIDFIEIPLLLKQLTPSKGIEIPLVPFGKGFSKELVQVYSDKIDKVKKIRTDFLNKMKVFINDIERIIVDTENGDILIEQNGVDEASTLYQFGEGANKLFRILVQIILQKDGRILIDEVDAGIHHTRFLEFWKTILQFALLNNTQVFATTHNLECIKKFDEILNIESFNHLQKDSRVLTLVKISDNNIKSYTRKFDEFDYELMNDIEIRGNKEL